MKDAYNNFEMSVDIVNNKVFYGGKRKRGRKTIGTTEYYHEGKIWIEGRKGSDFELRLTNHMWQRTLFVLSVDGKSVMDGERAGMDSGGYIVEGRSTVRVPGWRLDNDEVAKFTFANPRESYSSKSGDGTSNCGVIGCLVFYEEQTRHIYNTAFSMPPEPFPMKSDPFPDVTFSAVGDSHYKGTRGMDPTATASTMVGSMSQNAISQQSLNITAVSQDPSLGTKFGNVTDFETTSVSFRRQINPVAKFAMYYESARALESMGISVRRTYRRRPDPFPEYRDDQGGCQPPSGWRDRS